MAALERDVVAGEETVDSGRFHPGHEIAQACRPAGQFVRQPEPDGDVRRPIPRDDVRHLSLPISVYL